MLARAVRVRARSRVHPGLHRGRVRETKVRSLYINHTPNTRTLGNLRVDSHESAHNFFCASRWSRYITSSNPRYSNDFSSQIIVHDSQNLFSTRLTQKQYLQVPTTLCYEDTGVFNLDIVFWYIGNIQTYDLACKCSRAQCECVRVRARILGCTEVVYAKQK